MGHAQVRLLDQDLARTLRLVDQSADCEALLRAVHAAEAALLDARRQLEGDEQPHPNAPGGDALTAEESLELAGSHERLLEAERDLQEAQTAWAKACGQAD